MKQLIYLIRHSKADVKRNHENNSDSFQIKNEKQILSVEGEARARKLSESNIFAKVDYVVSSNYVRAEATAKYIAKKHDLDLHIDEDLGERKFGISSYTELPESFFDNQYRDELYKIGNGENRKEVTSRMMKALNRVLSMENEYNVMLSHGTAITFLLMTYCEIKYDGYYRKFYYKDRLVFDGEFSAPEVFKLLFVNNKLVEIENIKIDY